MEQMDVAEIKHREILAHYGYVYTEEGPELITKIVADMYDLTTPQEYGSGYDLDTLHALSQMLQHLMYRHRS